MAQLTNLPNEVLSSISKELPVPKKNVFDMEMTKRKASNWGGVSYHTGEPILTANEHNKLLKRMQNPTLPLKLSEFKRFLHEISTTD